jgi:hypothetical protein
MAPPPYMFRGRHAVRCESGGSGDESSAKPAKPANEPEPRQDEDNPPVALPDPVEVGEDG